MTTELRTSEENVRPDKCKLSAPAAWVHTMWTEFGQYRSQVTFSPDSPFGIPGQDHSECYPVTSEPVYRERIIKKPRVVVR